MANIANQRWISNHNTIIYLHTKFRPNQDFCIFAAILDSKWPDIHIWFAMVAILNPKWPPRCKNPLIGTKFGFQVDYDVTN
jgi:hypothetical protein